MQLGLIDFGLQWLSGFVHIFTNKFPWLFHDFCDNFHDLISHYFTIRIKICSNDHSILTKMNEIFCFSTSWNYARCEGPCISKFSHAKTHTNISDSASKDLYSTQRTHHITIIIYLTPEFHFGNFSLSQVFTLRKNYNAYKDTRQQCSNYTVDFGEPISFFFFITGGILCACDELTKIHKSYKKRYNYIYIYNFNFSRFRFFSVFIL